MMRFLEHRIGDRRVLRLVAKWLKAGVMEDLKRQESLSERGFELRLEVLQGAASSKLEK